MSAVIVISGILFKWYYHVPVWVPLIIVLMVYILFYLLDIIRVRRDIKEINKLLQKLKEKEDNTVS
jgi:nitrate/nitrite transporter NarK